MDFFSFVLNNWYLFLALIVILVLLLMPSLGGRLGGYQDLEPSDAVKMINRENAVVVDVRDQGEWNTGHILGAKHVPLGELPQRLKKLEKFKDKPLIVNCRSGARSARACAQLRKAGFEKVYNLKGGVTGWLNAGFPLTKE
ncbi:rhodanese-like domain-containing protein [Ectothiorhodospiraceae bacterium 2226]|nr:rhodanese-like domain-containing protein [Ectothiorhodospiraceae bacterium 2226]